MKVEMFCEDLDGMAHALIDPREIVLSNLLNPDCFGFLSMSFTEMSGRHMVDFSRTVSAVDYQCK